MPLLLTNGSSKRKRKFRKKRATLSKKLSKLSKFVYKTIEAKYNDARFQPLVIGSNGWVRWALSDIDDGTGATNTERVGDKATIQSITTSVAFDKLQGDDFMRVLVVQFDDLDDPIASLAIPSILEYGNVSNNNPNGNNMDQIMSPYKVGSALKFKVLYDKVLTPLNRKQISVSEQVTAINAQRLLTIPNKSLRKYNNVIGFQPGQNQQRPIQNGIYMYIYSTSNRLTSVDGASEAFVITRMKYRDA